MEKIKQLLLCLIVSALVAFGSGPAHARPVTVRVAILKQVASIGIAGEKLDVRDENGVVLDVVLPLVVKRSGSAVSAGGMRVRALRVTTPGFLRINGRSYRGTTEILAAGSGLLVINELPLEEYLVGLINCEISSRWPLEAVKAQAVVARTFALYQREARKNLPYHLESTVLDQVYNGCDIEDSRAAAAVAATRNEVLIYEGRAIQAFFHSRCGGHTEASENVWSLRLPYLGGVECKYCAKSPAGRWEAVLSRRKIEAVLNSGGFRARGVRAMRPLDHYRSGRITDLEFISDRGRVVVPAVTFRRLAGYGVIKSTDFQVRAIGDDFFFTGNGNGHGVGLCQWGAKMQAEEGSSYREILSYYYPGVRLGRIVEE